MVQLLHSSQCSVTKSDVVIQHKSTARNNAPKFDSIVHTINIREVICLKHPASAGYSCTVNTMCCIACLQDARTCALCKHDILVNEHANADLNHYQQ